MKILQSCPLFSGFSAEEIASLLQSTGCAAQKLKKARPFPAIIWGCCFPAGYAFWAARQMTGKLSSTTFCPARHLAPHRFFEHTELSSIHAETQSEALLLPAEQVWQLLDASQGFRKNYISFLCGRIAFLNRKIENLSGFSAESRLLAYLRQEQKNGALEVRSFQALAGMLGISRSSLYRAMDTLSAQGQIERQGNRIILKDSAAK